MNIREACAKIMGAQLAANIIADPKLDLGWCVIAAMADPRSDNHPAARIAIRAWLAQQKLETERSGGRGA